MTEICGDEARPKMAGKTAGEKRDTVFALIMLVASTALFVWYLAAESLKLPVAILFFCSAGFDQARRTTSPAVHALSNANWVLMVVFALTVIVPLLLK